MKKSILFVFAATLLSSTAFAEKVRVYTDYSPVRILRVVGEADFEVEASKSNLKGNFKEIESSEIPINREDRDAWKFLQGEIVAEPQLKAEKKAKKERIMASEEKLKALGLTDEDLKNLKIGGA